MWQVFVVILVVGVIIVAIAATWNTLLTISLFRLVWLPPLLLAAPIVLLPSVITWFVCRVYKEQGRRKWNSSKDAIRSAWHRSPSGWLILPFLATFVLVGAIVRPWATLWPGSAGWPFLLRDEWGWSEESVHRIFLSRSWGAGFIVGLPTTLAAISVHYIVRFFFVRRVVSIQRHIHGTDEHTTALAACDDQIRSAYLKLGSQRCGRHADAYRAWVTDSVGTIVRNPNAASGKFWELRAGAIAELSSLEKCIERYDAAKAAYQAGLVRLRKAPSLALLSSLEDAGNILVSPGLLDIIESQQWHEALTVLDEVATELRTIEKLAEDRMQSDDAHGVLTLEQALYMLGLPQGCSRSQVQQRRKELSKIFHPDPIQDAELKQWNENKLKDINAACDLLLRS